MYQLQQNTTLKGGEYKIIQTLGQGGFGITYLATQINLNRKVAVKEFFMEKLCQRDATSRVTLGTEGSREMVERFKQKFLKEARSIASLNHRNIVRIHDVFEENGTAYYVMEYAEGGSLADKVKREGCLAESEATRYILRVAEALGYIHQRKMSHLDVKPSNIMLNAEGEPVLIDFGLAKQYDAETGGQTSSTPVGVSEGYAPIEQYMEGGVAAFSPETDIYALGATYYKLLTGTTPPNASYVSNKGLPVAELKSAGVSARVVAAVVKAMQPRQIDRFSNVADFAKALTKGVGHKDGPAVKPPRSQKSQKSDETVVMDSEKKKTDPSQSVKDAPKNAKGSRKIDKKTWLWWAAEMAVAGVCLGIYILRSPSPTLGTSAYTPDIQTYTANGVSFKMVEVRGGTFLMGATSEMDEPWYDEKPAHRVTLTDDYWMGETEVTQALWKAVMGSNPSEFKGDDRPVENVSWEDCQDFIEKLNRITGKRFRLPMEAEWEYAARGGGKSRGYQYAGSSNLDEVAWYNGNSGDEPHPVGQKAPNELGLYDMSGNVYEWCQDWYGRHYRIGSQTNPAGPSSGSDRVLRGGSWYSRARNCRSSYRNYYTPDCRYSFNGFRLVLSE